MWTRAQGVVLSPFHWPLEMWEQHIYKLARSFKNISSFQESLLLSPLVAVPLVIYVISLFSLIVTIISYLAIKWVCQQLICSWTADYWLDDAYGTEVSMEFGSPWQPTYLDVPSTQQECIYSVPKVILIPWTPCNDNSDHLTYLDSTVATKLRAAVYTVHALNLMPNVHLNLLETVRNGW